MQNQQGDQSCYHVDHNVRQLIWEILTLPTDGSCMNRLHPSSLSQVAGQLTQNMDRHPFPETKDHCTNDTIFMIATRYSLSYDYRIEAFRLPTPSESCHEQQQQLRYERA
jgi:hypothetical protein